MTKLKLGSLEDDKPVKVTLELPASVHRDLSAYAAALAKQNGDPAIEPMRLIGPMLSRFMASDRAFKGARHTL